MTRAHTTLLRLASLAAAMMRVEERRLMLVRQALADGRAALR